MYRKKTTERGAYNYFSKLKNVKTMFIVNNSSKICIVGYYNIRNFLTKYYK